MITMMLGTFGIIIMFLIFLCHKPVLYRDENNEIQFRRTGLNQLAVWIGGIGTVFAILLMFIST